MSINKASSPPELSSFPAQGPDPIHFAPWRLGVTHPDGSRHDAKTPRRGGSPIQAHQAGRRTPRVMQGVARGSRPNAGSRAVPGRIARSPPSREARPPATGWHASGMTGDGLRGAGSGGRVGVARPSRSWAMERRRPGGRSQPLFVLASWREKPPDGFAYSTTTRTKRASPANGTVARMSRWVGRAGMCRLTSQVAASSVGATWRT